MNYLAHLYFSQPTPESRVGNLLGDYQRGVDRKALPVPVRRGLENHLAVDRFTDHHPLVCQARRGFSASRRRFAGIALDVLFDHFLIRHWQRFSSRDFTAQVQRFHADLRSGEELMPTRMRQVTERMIRDDWFHAYAELDNIGYALDRIAGRIRFANDFSGVIEEIRDREAELEAAFLTFFPELERHVAGLALERE